VTPEPTVTPTVTPEPTVTPTGTPLPTPTMTPEPTPTPPPSGKVAVCHKGRKTIIISARAVPAHLRHGDTLGPCANPTNGRVVMCKEKRGKAKNVLVHESKVSKKAAKGLTSGECK
jgi:hypothetical protein